MYLLIYIYPPIFACLKPIHLCIYIYPSTFACLNHISILAIRHNIIVGFNLHFLCVSNVSFVNKIMYVHIVCVSVCKKAKVTATQFKQKLPNPKEKDQLQALMGVFSYFVDMFFIYFFIEIHN